MLSASNMFLVFVGRNYRVDVVGSWAALIEPFKRLRVSVMALIAAKLGDLIHIPSWQQVARFVLDPDTSRGGFFRAPGKRTVQGAYSRDGKVPPNHA